MIGSGVSLLVFGFGNACQITDFMLPIIDPAPRWAPISVTGLSGSAFGLGLPLESTLFRLATAWVTC